MKIEIKDKPGNLVEVCIVLSYAEFGKDKKTLKTTDVVKILKEDGYNLTQHISGAVVDNRKKNSLCETWLFAFSSKKGLKVIEESVMLTEIPTLPRRRRARKEKKNPIHII